MGARERTARERDAEAGGAPRIDLTVGAESTDELRVLATRDGLTGLANRDTMIRVIDDALENHTTVGAPAALLFCDLDHFKLINDTLGHRAGDDVLSMVARRLEATCERDATIGRLGGDEFAIVLTGEPATRAETLAATIVNIMREPLRVDDRILPMSMSIGVAHARDSHRHPSELLRDADVALYEAKTGGRDRVDVFSPSHAERLQRRSEIERDLRLGIGAGELTLRYQPIIDLASGMATGVEALVRWNHPVLGLLEPGAFIDIAEETGLVALIDRFTLEAACRQLAAWAELRDAPRMLSVNMSARDVRDPGMVDFVRTTIEGAGIDPASLCIEITESSMLFAGDGALRALHALRDLGCYLALDDFGTGYSSLLAVRRLPIEVVKIDRSFVDGLATDAQDSAVVAAVMSLAHALGLHVIAEGVEAAEQARVLLDLGCRAAQGFLFARPLGSEAIIDLWRVDPDERRELYEERPRVSKRRYRAGLRKWNRRPLVGTGLLPRRVSPWRSSLADDAH